ncbi:MAG: hypothetical protein ACTSYI_04805 [Promethearchaeota archaeon]
MIWRSSALECPNVGHYWAVLSVFRLGVHDCSRVFICWKKGCRSIVQGDRKIFGIRMPGGWTLRGGIGIF